MIFILSALVGLAFGDPAGESKFARGLLRRLSRTEAPIVFLTARDGHLCRGIIDHLGLWAARSERVWPVEDAGAAADFALNSAATPSRFGDFARHAGLALVTRIEDGCLEDRVARAIAARALRGGDRSNWGFRSTEAVAMVFAVRPTAPFFGTIVRDLFSRADGTGTFGGCRYHLFARETLSGLADGCAARLAPRQPSGWAKPTA